MRPIVLKFQIKIDENTSEKYLETPLCGKPLLTTPQLNKSTAFTISEREAFGLFGKLPHRVESLDEQVKRAYIQFSAYSSNLQRNIYLNNLHDKNQVLFYKLLTKNLGEMLPMIYTPIVGIAVKKFSHEYRQPRGLYIAYPDRNHIEEVIDNRSNPDIDLIVVTDGEGVLGIGDQGIGGMDIPVAKLMVYSLCGGIDPCRTLPIFLDAGTNNQTLLDDPLYLGWRKPRIHGAEYDAFILQFVSAIQKKFPNAFLHWEDFGRGNARSILDKFQDKLCTFNDDIQGTGAVPLAAILAATDVTKCALPKNKIIVYGAGSAGTGISDQIVDAMIAQGASSEDAHNCFYLLDRQGLLVQGDGSLTLAQEPFARSPQDIKDMGLEDKEYIGLNDVVKAIKPTILIGTSAQPGAFSQSIVETMSEHCDRPVIFPLSNPTEKCEAQPKDILLYSKGKALIATGTNFEPVEYQNRLTTVAQCNNALVFPGIGLGILLVDAKRLTKQMIWKASEALSKHAPIRKDIFAPLLPSLDEAKMVAKHIALAVAQCAIEEGLAKKNTHVDLNEHLDTVFWEPAYLPFRRMLEK